MAGRGSGGAGGNGGGGALVGDRYPGTLVGGRISELFCAAAEQADASNKQVATMNLDSSFMAGPWELA